MVDENVTVACAKKAMARCDLRFTQREAREWTGWTDYQVKVHLAKLVAMEYVLIHRAMRGQSFVYELLYDGKGVNGKPFLLGLIDIGAVEGEPDREHQNPGWVHRNEGWEHSGSIQVGTGLVPGSNEETSTIANADKPFMKVRVRTFKNTHGGGNGKDSPSYPAGVVASSPARGEA